MSNISERGLQCVQLLCDELASGVVDLPSFPDVAFRIKKALDDPNASAKQVATVVGTDPVFTARLLNVANSAALGTMPDRQIRDIPTAIARMGFKMAHTVAMSIAFQQLLKNTAGKKLANEFEMLWQHSLNVAATSYLIAKAYRRINPDEAMIAGLMHDVGKIYIMVRAEESFPDLCDDIESLQTVIQEWHTRVGEAILKNWGLASDMAAVAGTHETLDRQVEVADLSDAVLIGNLLAYLMDDESNNKCAPPQWDEIPAFSRLGLNDDAIRDITENSREEIRSIIFALGR